MPPTVEGLKCERECQLVFTTCQAGDGRNRRVCAQEQYDCRVTCPGATFDDGSPTIVQNVTTNTQEVPAPVLAAPSEGCVADQLPEWKTATAREKKALLERCRATTPPPAP